MSSGRSNGKGEITRRLSTGQTIKLMPHDDKELRKAFDYLAGFSKRQQLTTTIAAKQKDFSALTVGSAAPTKSPNNASSPSKSFRMDLRTEDEIKTDNYFALKDEISALEDKLRTFEMSEHVISYKDLELVLKQLGTNMNRKTIQHMIWEVDEKGNENIGWDEFQLTYYRNIQKDPKFEPNYFFHVMEFTIFDGQHKGFIVEDDCMEILFARYGSGQLEKELHMLFGNKLRAMGGDGLLTLSSYLSSVLVKTGHRAIVP